MLTVLGQILWCSVTVCITRHGCFYLPWSGQPQLSPVSAPSPCHTAVGPWGAPEPAHFPPPHPSQLSAQQKFKQMLKQELERALNRSLIPTCPQLAPAAVCRLSHSYFPLAAILNIFCCVLLYDNLESIFLMPDQKKTAEHMQRYQQWRVDSSLCTCSWKEREDRRIL